MSFGAGGCMHEFRPVDGEDLRCCFCGLRAEPEKRMGYNLDDHHAHSDLSTRTVQILNDKERPLEDDFNPSALKRKTDAAKAKQRAAQDQTIRKVVDAIKKDATHCAETGGTQYSCEVPPDIIGSVARHFEHLGFGTTASTTVLVLRW